MTLEEALLCLHGRRQNLLALMRGAKKDRDVQMERWWRSMAGIVQDMEGILLRTDECREIILKIYGAQGLERVDGKLLADGKEGKSGV